MERGKKQHIFIFWIINLASVVLLCMLILASSFSSKTSLENFYFYKNSDLAVMGKMNIFYEKNEVNKANNYKI